MCFFFLKFYGKTFLELSTESDALKKQMYYKNAPVLLSNALGFSLLSSFNKNDFLLNYFSGF